MENAVRLSDQTLLAEKSVELALPSLPAKPGKIVVLRFRTVSYSERRPVATAMRRSR